MNTIISNEQLTVTLSAVGAEIQRITRQGIDYLWDGDPQFWNRRAPTLFPYIARLTNESYSYKGKIYHLPIHGFAPTALFDATKIEPETVTFRLAADKATLELYPFNFIFLVRYSLNGSKLEIDYIVENHGDDTMYFGVGGHPGFRLPLEDGLCFEDYYLEFEEEYTPIRIGFSKDCFLNGDNKPFPLDDGKRLRLTHDLFDRDAVVFEGMSSTLTLKAKGGKRQICARYPQMPYLGIWHYPQLSAPYVCIEPWSSLPSRCGVVEDIEKQADLIALKAGVVYSNTISFEFS